VPIRRAIDLAAQVSDGLAKAHEAGIVHRDLKPDNIMVSKDGFAKILDFGIAKLQTPTGGSSPAETGLTQTGFIVGTPDYMSPEQASGKPLTFRSDQFSLGLILYEMLAGRRAFHKATAVQTLSAIIQDEAEPVENFNARVPVPLRWLVERCLSKEPEERYNSSRDLSRELKLMRERAGELLAASDTRTSTSRPAPAVSTATFASTAAGPAAASANPAPGVATAAAIPVPAGRRRARRLMEFLAVLVAAAALFGGGLWAGMWFREQQVEPPPPMWKADLLLGSTTRALAPRVSPDGGTLAFVTQSSGASQVAVLKPASGDWTVLTRPGKPGTIQKVCWTRDGNKLLFDRVSDTPHGIFSIPPLGGEERLVLENAQSPEALPDGSLLFVRRNPERHLVIHRFWPEAGKIQPLGPAVTPEGSGLLYRVFPDGRRAIFWGRLADAKGAEPRRLHLLDLEKGTVSPFAPELPLSPPIAVGPDGRSVLAFLTAGDLQQLASVPESGEEASLLFPVTERPGYLDSGQDGSLYVDTIDSAAELLRVTPAGGLPERIATTGGLFMSPVELPGGGVLVPLQALGRRRLFVTGAAGELRPLLDISEQAMPPAAMVGDRHLAFLSGAAGQPPVITLASVPEGRVVRRLDASRGASPQSLAASPDGSTIFYVHSGFLHAISSEGGEARQLVPASAVAVDSRPPAPSLIVQLTDAGGVRLSRLPLAGGNPAPIPIVSSLRLAPSPLSPAAVGPDGRIAVAVAATEEASRGVALLDPSTGFLERVPVSFDGDLHYPAWSRDGALLAVGVSVRSSLWRFRPHEAPGSPGAAAPAR
jgi:hypothetical protein